MTRFPPIATPVGTAEFSVREKIAGPDDDGDEKDGNGNVAILAEQEAL